MATHPGMANLHERMPYKTWVLKVSIHCEGCKKKVRKVIQSIEGVYTVDIDIKQHRVVVTGNVDGDTLVKKLIKSGKIAELWPQMAPPQERKPRALKKKEVKIDPEPSIPQEISHGGSEREKQDKKVETEHDSAKTVAGAPAKGESSNLPAKNHQDGREAAVHGGDGGGGPAVEQKHEAGKKPEMGSAANSPPAKATAEDSGGGTGESTQPSESGSIGKKKKKKGQSGTPVGEPSDPSVPASRGLLFPDDVIAAPEANLSRPRQHGHEYPPHYYTPPPPPPPPAPVATVSYSTAYPTTSNTMSYYAAPLPYSNAYTYPQPENEQDYQQPLDSFELFSDENPNGCYIM